MKQIVLCFTLLLAAPLLAQQQEQSPPKTIPPTFSPGQTPGEMPPDTHAPPAQTMSDQQVEGEILQQFREEPSLADTNVDARANDNSVVLTGSVDTMAQHDLAVQIAQANAGERKIVDKIMVRQQT